MRFATLMASKRLWCIKMMNKFQLCNATVTFYKLDQDKWGYDLTTPRGEISSAFYTKEVPTSEGLLLGFQRHIERGDTDLLECLHELFTKEQVNFLLED